MNHGMTGTTVVGIRVVPPPFCIGASMQEHCRVAKLEAGTYVTARHALPSGLEVKAGTLTASFQYISAAYDKARRWIPPGVRHAYAGKRSSVFPVDPFLFTCFLVDYCTIHHVHILLASSKQCHTLA